MGETVPSEWADRIEEDAILRSLFASTPTIAFFQDLQGRFRFVTSNAARSFGRTREELENRTWQDTGQRSDLMHMLDDLRNEALITGEPLKGALFSPQDSRYYEYRTVPVLGVDGGVRGTFTTAVDITELKEMKDLRESEERLRAIVNNVRDAAFVKDREGHYLVVNPAILHSLGKSPNDVLGKDDLEVQVDLEMARNIMTNDRRVMRSGISEVVEEEVRTPDGYRSVLTSLTPFRDRQGQIIGIVGIVRDVTDQTRMENELRASETKYRQLVDNALEGIWAVDREWKITYVNQSMADMLGYSSEELVGHPVTSLMDVAGREKANELIARRESGVNEVHDFEFLRKDGTRIYTRVSASVLLDPRGHFAGSMALVSNVTDRRRAEEALRQSEERFRSLIEGAPVAIAMSREGFTTYSNPRYLKMFGYSSEPELYGRPFIEQIAPEDRGRALEFARAQAEGRGGQEETELLGVRKDGSTFPFHAAITIVDLPDGPAVMGLFTDITERKNAEEALLESERRLSTLMNNLPGMVYRCRNDPNYTMEFISEGCLSLTGYPSKDLLFNKRMSYVDLIVPEHREMVRNEVQAGIREGRPYKMTYAIHAASGELKWVWEQGEAVISPDGDVVALEGFIADMTEQKMAEEEMAHSRRKFESLFSASNEGIALHDIVYDREGRIINYRIVDVNPAYERIIGIPKSRAVGRLATELYGTDEPPYLDIFTQVCVTGKAATMETYFPPMGKHFFISTFSPAKGQFATVFIDITEQKRLEEELVEARSRAEIYVDLLVHDVSNYNTAAMGYLQLAEMRLKLDEQDRKLIVRPLQVLSNSSELIANVRDLKMVEAGREKARSFDICTLLREVKEAYEDPPGREVTINLRESDSCWVLASGLIRDAFSNIVSNSIKHTSGPVTVDILVDRPRQEGNGQVRVSIEDNGPGIPDDRKDSIFDRSLMGLTKPVSRGLGLYLVKRLVEEYDGEVWVEDRVPGDHTKGARFVIVLPAASSG